MLYLLDANVLIRAHEDYYGIDQVPQFWDWLVEQAVAGVVKMPFEIHNEIVVSKGLLRDWITQTYVEDNLVLDEEVDRKVFNYVLATGYAPDLNDGEMEKVGRDPFLVAYAKMAPDRVVVTKEVSRPSKSRGNRKVPDACVSVGVPWMTDFAFFKSAGFTTR